MEILGAAFSLVFGIVSLVIILRFMLRANRRATEFGVGKSSELVPMTEAHRVTLRSAAEKLTWLTGGVCVFSILFFAFMAYTTSGIQYGLWLTITFSLLGPAVAVFIAYYLGRNVRRLRADLTGTSVVRTRGPISVSNYRNMWMVETADSSIMTTDTVGMALMNVGSATLEYSPQATHLFEAWSDDNTLIYRDKTYFPRSSMPPGAAQP